MARGNTEICGSDRTRYRSAQAGFVAELSSSRQPQDFVIPPTLNSYLCPLWRRQLCVIPLLLVLLTAFGWSQNENDVHVTPRAKPPAPDTSKPGITDPAL